MSITTEFTELNTVNIDERELKKEKTTLRLSDNMGVGFSKVLEKRATVYVENVEVADDSISYVIGVNTNVIFVDLKGEIRQSSYSGNVTKTLTIDGISERDGIILRARSDDLEIDKIVGEDLTLTLNYTLFAVIYENNAFSALTELSGAYARSKDVKYINFAKTLRKELTFDESVDGAEDVKTVLSSISSIKELSATVKTDNIELSGVVETDITYLKNGEDNEIITVKKSFDINETVEMPNAKEGDDVMIFPSSKTTFVNYAEDENAFDVVCEFVISLGLMKTERTNIVTDVFSKEYELDTQVSSERFVSLDGVISSNASDSANYAIEDLNSVVAVLSSTSEAINMTSDKNAIYVDVLAKLFAIVDIDGSYISREFDVPVTVTVPHDAKDRTYIANTSVIDGDVVKNGEGVTASVNVKVELNAISTEIVPVITSLVVGEEKDKERRAIIVYTSKGGESEIDLAKKVNMTPDEILEQEDLIFPLVEGKKIVLYRQRT